MKVECLQREPLTQVRTLAGLSMQYVRTPSAVLSRRMGGRRRIYSDVDTLRESQSVRVWLQGMKDGPHRKTALYNLARYLRWRNKSHDRRSTSGPDELINECLNGTNLTLVEHLRPLLEYCEGETFRSSALETRIKAFKDVNSFYRSNLVTLPKAKLRVKDERKGVSNEVTATQFLQFARKVMVKGRLSVRGRACLLVMLQSGMDASTLGDSFNFYAYPQLVEFFGTDEFTSWDSSRCPVRVDLRRPKSSYRYYSFLDVDAIEALKDWLAKRVAIMEAPIRIHEPENPSSLPRSDPIFVHRSKLPMQPRTIGILFLQAGKHAGVNLPPIVKPQEYKGATIRYPFHSHEVRDTLITLARRVKADPIAANWFVGHSIDKLKYDKSPWDDPEYFRAEYIKIARPHLNVATDFALAPTTTDSAEIERERRENEAKQVALMERIEALEAFAKRWTVNEPAPSNQQAQSTDNQPPPSAQESDQPHHA